MGTTMLTLDSKAAIFSSGLPASNSYKLHIQLAPHSLGEDTEENQSISYKLEQYVSHPKWESVNICNCYVPEAHFIPDSSSLRNCVATPCYSLCAFLGWRSVIRELLTLLTSNCEDKRRNCFTSCKFVKAKHRKLICTISKNMPFKTFMLTFW